MVDYGQKKQQELSAQENKLLVAEYQKIKTLLDKHQEIEISILKEISEEREEEKIFHQKDLEVLIEKQIKELLPRLSAANDPVLLMQFVQCFSEQRAVNPFEIFNAVAMNPHVSANALATIDKYQEIETSMPKEILGERETGARNHSTEMLDKILKFEEGEAQKAKQEAEAKQKADQEAEAKQKADQEAEAKQKADQEAAAKQKAKQEAEAKQEAKEKLLQEIRGATKQQLYSIVHGLKSGSEAIGDSDILKAIMNRKDISSDILTELVKKTTDTGLIELMIEQETKIGQAEHRNPATLLHDIFFDAVVNNKHASDGALKLLAPQAMHFFEKFGNENGGRRLKEIINHTNAGKETFSYIIPKIKGHKGCQEIIDSILNKPGITKSKVGWITEKIKEQLDPKLKEELIKGQLKEEAAMHQRDIDAAVKKQRIGYV